MTGPELLPDYRESPWLRFGKNVALKGDPKTPQLFAQALAFLDALTDHFDESDPWPQKTTTQVIDELSEHNRQAQTDGNLSEHEEVTLSHVKALSQRRLLAFEETGWSLTHYDHLVRFVAGLIDQAMADITPQHSDQMEYQRLLASFPAEDLVEEDEPDYPDVEPSVGCRTCVSGEPCRARIEEDISEILSATGLPSTEELACLQWMIETGYSSLTHSIASMAEVFTTAHREAAERLTTTVLVFEANGNDLLVLPIDLARSEANLLELAQQEATRLNIAIDQINLRFAAG